MEIQTFENSQRISKLDLQLHKFCSKTAARFRNENSSTLVKFFTNSITKSVDFTVVRIARTRELKLTGHFQSEINKRNL